MKNTLTALTLLTIGLLLVAVGFYGATIFNGRTVDGFSNEQLSGTVENSSGQSSNKEALPFLLSAEQKNALIAMGIDPARAPSSISPDQQDCLIANLGEEKFATIKNGAVPSMMDYVKLKSCF